jgi:DNA-binding response OmpR family regulator
LFSKLKQKLYLGRVNNGEHILIVEDDPKLSEFIYYNFDSAGFKTSIISDREEVLPIILGERPDQII